MLTARRAALLARSSMRYNGLYGSIPSALGRLTALERLCVRARLQHPLWIDVVASDD